MTNWFDFNAGAAAPATTSTDLLFCTGKGQSDTHAKTLSDGRSNPHRSAGTDYQGITGKQIVAMLRDPPSVPKAEAQWFIPSTYRASDGRSHDAQRENGEFWFLSLDEDAETDNNLTLDEIDAAVARVCGNVARMIYSTRGATAERRKWRALIPLMRPIGGADYSDTVAAFNAELIEASAGVLIPDAALERSGQLIYLPNRGEHYEHRLHKLDRLDLTPDHAIIKRREANRATRRAAEAEARKRREARQRKAASHPDGAASVIEAFSANTTVADDLDRYGYTRSRNGKDWRSPNSTTGSFAVRDYGQFWISLSGSDAALEIGNPSPSGMRIGDAFDLFVHYEHGGGQDGFKAAIKAYAKEIGQDYKSQRERTEASPAANIDTGAAATTPPPALAPTRFTLRPSHEIPPRQWLYGKHLIGGFVSLTVAPGGVGKSSMVLVDSLAMATGRDLLGAAPARPLRVWVWNGEDPREEIERRITAACIQFGITSDELGDRLLVDSGRDLPITMATMGGDGFKIAKPVVEAVKAAIRKHQIDVFVVDPFVTSHEVSENDNTAINAVASEWRRIADETGCSIELVHHTNKAGAGDGDAQGIYASRGGGALIDAVRAARYLVRMTQQEADRLGVEEEEARITFRVCTDGKANLAPPEKATWRRMVSVSLGNGGSYWPEGDHVGVCTGWSPPDAFEGVSTRDLKAVQEAIAALQEPPRESDKGPTWAGFTVGEVLGLCLGERSSTKAERTGSENAARAKVRRMLREWFATGALVVEETKDQKGNPRKIVTVGEIVRADEC